MRIGSMYGGGVDRPRSRPLAWPAFSGLILAAFVLRAVALLAVLPPFEGWDEYQHLGYIAFLDENGRPPSPAEKLPATLFAALRAYPHSTEGARHLAGLGVRDYGTYWKEAERLQTTGAVPLMYEAQHPPLYYELSLPLFRALGGTQHTLAVVTGLRLLNVALAAAALGIVLVVLGRVVADRGRARLLALIIVLNPLFLANSARVANDSLAVLLGTGAVAVLLSPPGWPLWIVMSVAGGLLGLATATKATSLMLLPVVVAGAARLLKERSPRRLEAIVLPLVLVGAFLGPTVPVLVSRLGRPEGLALIQESAANVQSGRVLGNYLAAAARVDWSAMFFSWFGSGSLWVGGWSFLRPPRIAEDTFTIALAASVAGLLLQPFTKVGERRPLFRGPWPLMASALVLGGVAAGLAFHSVQSMTAWGRVSTNAWYAAVGIPWLLCLLYQGILGLRPAALSLAAGLLLPLSYLSAEVGGLILRMVPEYSGGAGGSEALRRIATLHPTWLSPAVGIAALVLAMILVVWTGWSAVREFRRDKGDAADPSPVRRPFRF